MFTQKFAAFACLGDVITCDVDGFTVYARLEFDYDTKVDDFDCYTPDVVAAWNNDDWRFVGVVLSVERADVTLVTNGPSLWGCEMNFPAGDNARLAEVANELLPEALDLAKAKLAELCAAANKENDQ
jgi:hypothetical protein